MSVTYDEEIALIRDVLIANGVGREEADLQAATLAEGDLRGHPSHGIRRLPVIVDRLRTGVTAPGQTASFAWSGQSMLQVDGNNCLGPVAAHHAISKILERAADTGVAAAAVRNAGHIGMVAPYVERMANAGFVGIAFTVSEALVHPWGGKRAMVGTNPIGIAVPTLTEPVVLDMSTASISAGKILDYAARGQAIPEGWAVDSEGRSTTDPHAASEGAISPFGGPKGYGLGLLIEAMVGLVSGSAYGREVFGTLDRDKTPTKGDLFIAFNTGFADRERRLQSLEDYLTELRASHADGKTVLVPGDRARTTREEALNNGIPIDASLWQRVNDLKGQ